MKNKNKDNTLDAGLLSLLTKAIPDYVNIIDADGNVVYSNRSVRRDDSVFDYLTPFYRDLAQQAIKEARATGQTREIELRADIHGELNWFLSRFVPLNDALGRMLAISTQVTEYHNILDEWALSQRRLKDHIFNTPLAAMSLDMDMRVTEWNPAAEKLFGWTSEEAVGKTPAELMVQANEIDRMHHEMAGVVDNKSPVVMVYTNRDRKGDLVITRTFSTPVLDVNGDVIGVEALIEDITEQQRLFDELEVSRQMLSAQLDNTPLAAFTWDQQFSIASWNHSAEKMFGWSAAEAIGKSFREILIAPENIVNVEGAFVAAFSGKSDLGRDGVYELIRKDGARLICHSFTSIIKNKEGQVVRLSSLVDDITERQQLLDELEASRQQLVAQLYNTPLAAIVWDSQFRVREWNSAAEELYGFSRKEALGRYGYDLLIQGEERIRAKAVSDAAFATGNIPPRNAYFAWRKNGEKIYTENFNTPIRNANGDVIAIATLCRDMTADVRLNEALNKARQEAEDIANAKTEFLSNMSHEIRTPIHGIIGATDLLLKEPLPDTAKEYADIIRMSSQNLLGIINNILDLSKLNAGSARIDSKPFNLRDTLSMIVSSMNPLVLEKGLFLRFSCPDHVDTFVGDEGRIRQIVTNLIGNAIKFTDFGGIDLTLRVGTPVYGCSNVIISVRDTGQGIAEDAVRHIFEEFAQIDAGINRRFGGTGLGLAISQRFAQLLGGEITVESKPGQGSEFSLLLPLVVSDQPLVSAEIAPDMAEHPEYKKRLLVVDDNAVNLSIIKRMLESLGAEVKTAVNGKLAVEQFHKECFDAIFMDLQMPVMDGLQAAELIRKESNIPIVLMSANVFDVDSELCRKSGVDRFICKPFRQADIANILSDVFTTQ
ncbi:MAG TPA: PAS domain S-box protein [Pseudomonadales bacterium]